MIFDPENFKDNKSNWVTTFPIYNATETNRQKYVDKYVWEFNSDNAITSELMSSDVYPSNAQESDIKYGTTYDLLVYMAIILMAVRILLRHGMACQRPQV